jgi:hypothetical protein
MNVTEDIIRDLLPAYHSDEASADTRRLVDDYFAAHPAFAAEAGQAFGSWPRPDEATPSQPGSANEKIALKRAKRTLRWQQALLAIASTLSLNALSLGFSFQIENGSIQAHWLTLPGQKLAVAILLVAATGFWFGYFRVAQRVRRKILG